MTDRSSLRPAMGVAVMVAVVRRPDLWWTALSTARRLSPPGWWRRAPRLPLPDAGLWSFRMLTAYGAADARPVPSDVVTYLEWCRATSPLARTRHSSGGGGSPRGVPPRTGG